MKCRRYAKEKKKKKIIHSRLDEECWAHVALKKKQLNISCLIAHFGRNRGKAKVTKDKTQCLTING